jgi:two-component system alkaline phosphatase synthesis response regulator PhoP
MKGAATTRRRTNARRILLVDDEAPLRRMLSDRLTAEGYCLDTAADGAVASRMAGSGQYDLVILDLGLPLKDGLEVCRDLRRDQHETPILMLTARDTTADKVTGLRTGADDYLTKPFESLELLARIEALLRRRAPARIDRAEYRFGDVVVRSAARLVLRAAQPVRLSPQELRLLLYLVRHDGLLLSREELLNAVWGYHATPETRTVDVHISWLRQKLEPDPQHPRFIVTVFGLGYRFDAGEPAG